MSDRYSIMSQEELLTVVQERDAEIERLREIINRAFDAYTDAAPNTSGDDLAAYMWDILGEGVTDDRSKER